MKCLLILCFCFLSKSILANNDDNDTTENKKGVNIGAIPVLAYSSDVGLRYGGLLNIFSYGNGEHFPKYNHSLYFELSTTTKGSGCYQIIYDTDKLLPKIRLTSEIAYLPEKILDFYGFNGYESVFNQNYQNPESPEYKSRVFYKMSRKMLRIRQDFQGNIGQSNLKWFGGILFYNINLDTININEINRDISINEQLPPVNGGLYGIYLKDDYFAANESKGGQHLMFRIGSVFDSRDNEANPGSGIWADAQLIISPPAFKNTTVFSRMVLGYRQYFTIIRKKLIIATRALYQGHVSGKYPFYLAPIMFSVPPDYDHDGLGGAKTLRGILRNRVVGLNWVMANIELRYKFVKGNIWGQNVYLSSSVFYDAGLITKRFDLNKNIQNTSDIYLLTGSNGNIHQSVGGGLHFAINENFIISADYGFALDKRDGTNGLYVGIGYLY